jgi:CRISPR-associated protein Cas2
MWMMVMFDLPVVEPKDRKQAVKFRKLLLDEGFEMSQFSVYVRFCGNREKTEAYTRKIESHLPPKGKISILFFTDKQFSRIITFYKRNKKNMEKNSDQYLIFDMDNY